MEQLTANLEKVQKPGRYLGGEIGSVVKDPGGVDLSVALAFPDVYEIGMSHVGLRILYGLINSHPGFLAERVMAPWVDWEEVLRRENTPLSTLESGRPLSEFDLVGFSLQYELTYTNVLNMLELGGIPLLAAERGQNDPLVIGGGPNAFNPEPVADFFDLFYLGDAEAGLIALLEHISAWKKANGSKQELFESLAGRPGVYIPSFFQPIHDQSGLIREIRPLRPEYERAVRVVSPDLDRIFIPDCPIVPFVQPIHDRIAVEVARGCTRGCRFCQAGFVYRPVRERRPGTILQTASRALLATGMDEASFLSLSTGDYSALEGLMSTFMDEYESRRVALALPSLRVKSITPEMMRQIKRVRKTGFTLAPEAATQRLRNVINKDLTEEDLLNAAGQAFRLGWRLIKLYFMLGLPTETDEDVAAIADLAQKVRAGTRSKVNVSFAVFVPKPHTPFQWEAMLDPERMRARMDLLFGRLRKPGLAAKWNQPETSLLEGILSRGDRRLGRVIRQVQARGGRFDAWNEELKIDLWLEAMDQAGLTSGEYLRARSREEVLPWSHLVTGATADYLWGEREKAYREEPTPDCRDGACGNCGVCDFKELKPRLCQSEPRETGPATLIDPKPGARPGRDQLPPSGDQSQFDRFHLVYAKDGPAGYLSHLETIQVFLRAFRRAGLEFRYSQGFHPQPRIHFASALSVGLTSRDEHLEVDLIRAPDPDELTALLAGQLPAGFTILRTEKNAHPGRKKLKSRGARYRIEAGADLFDADTVRTKLNEGDLTVWRKSRKGNKKLDLKSLVGEVNVLTPRIVEFTLVLGEKGTVRPKPAAQALFDLDDRSLETFRVIKLETLLD